MFQRSPPPQQEGLRGLGDREARAEHPLARLKVPLSGQVGHQGDPDSAEAQGTEWMIGFAQ